VAKWDPKKYARKLQEVNRQNKERRERKKQAKQRPEPDWLDSMIQGLKIDEVLSDDCEFMNLDPNSATFASAKPDDDRPAKEAFDWTVEAEKMRNFWNAGSMKQKMEEMEQEMRRHKSDRQEQQMKEELNRRARESKENVYSSFSSAFGNDWFRAGGKPFTKESFEESMRDAMGGTGFKAGGKMNGGADYDTSRIDYQGVVDDHIIDFRSFLFHHTRKNYCDYSPHSPQDLDHWNACRQMFIKWMQHLNSRYAPVKTRPWNPDKPPVLVNGGEPGNIDWKPEILLEGLDFTVDGDGDQDFYLLTMKLAEIKPYITQARNRFVEKYGQFLIYTLYVPSNFSSLAPGTFEGMTTELDPALKDNQFTVSAQGVAVGVTVTLNVEED